MTTSFRDAMLSPRWGQPVVNETDPIDDVRKQLAEVRGDKGLVEELGTGVVEGLYQIPSMGGGLVKLAGGLTGVEPLKEVGQNISSYFEEKAKPYAGDVQSLADAKGFRDYAKLAAHGVGTVIPTVAATVLSGGMGGAGAVAARLGTGALSRFATKEALVAAIEAGALTTSEMAAVNAAKTAGQIAGMAASSYGMEAGSIAADSPKGSEFGTKEALRAAGAAVPAAAMDVIPEMRFVSRLPGFKQLQAITGKVATGNFLTRGLKEGATQGVIEGTTEAAQTAIEQKGAGKQLNANEIATAGFIGAVSGGLMGGPAGMIAKPDVKAETKTAVEAAKQALSQHAANPEQSLSEIYNEIVAPLETAAAQPVPPVVAPTPFVEPDSYQMVNPETGEVETVLNTPESMAMAREMGYSLTEGVDTYGEVQGQGEGREVTTERTIDAKTEPQGNITDGGDGQTGVVPGVQTEAGTETMPDAVLSNVDGQAGSDLSTVQSSDEQVDYRYVEAKALAEKNGSVTISKVQRDLRVGYNRAARIMEELRAEGVVDEDGVYIQETPKPAGLQPGGSYTPVPENPNIQVRREIKEGYGDVIALGDVKNRETIAVAQVNADGTLGEFLREPTLPAEREAATRWFKNALEGRGDAGGSQQGETQVGGETRFSRANNKLSADTIKRLKDGTLDLANESEAVRVSFFDAIHSINDTSHIPGSYEIHRDASLRSDLSRIAGVFGHSVTLLSSSSPTRFGGWVSPLDARHIYLVVNSKVGTQLQLLGHELIHQIKNNDKTLYDDLATGLFELKNNETMGKYFSAIQPDEVNWETGEATKTGTEEWVADIVGSNFGSESFWTTFSEVNPTLFVRLAQAARNLLNYVMENISERFDRASRSIRDVKKAEQVIAKTLQDYAKRTGETRFNRTGTKDMLRPAIMRDGVVKVAPAGKTHYDVKTVVSAKPRNPAEKFSVGFVTPDGEMLSRQEALGWLKENRPDVYKALDYTTRKNGLESQAYAHAEGLTNDESDLASAFLKKQFGTVDYMYSRGKGAGVAKDAIEKALKSVKAKLNIPVVVVESASDIPNLDNPGFDFNGVYHEVSIYLVADQLASVEEAQAVLLDHELRHAGLRAMMGRTFDGFLGRAWADKGADIRAFADEQGIDYKTKAGKLEATEEYIVSLAKSEKDSPLLDKFIALLREWARSMGLDLKISDAELRVIVSQAGSVMMKEEGKVRSTFEPVLAVRFNAQGVPVTWYSKLERHIDEKTKSLKGNKPVPASHFEGLLKDMKKDEIEATGIREFLGEHPTVTKEEVLDYLRENQIGLVDEVLGEDTSSPLEAELKTLSDRQRVLTNSDRSPSEYIDEWNDIDAQRKDLIKQIAEARNAEKPAHFSQYTEPGAVPGSYREMFVTAPMKGVDRDLIFYDWLDNYVESVVGESTSGKEWYAAQNRNTQTLIRNEYEDNNFDVADDRPGWQDGHSQYSEIQNPVVRIRFNERSTSADGTSYTPPRKTLFIEEMQGPSDANQQKMPEFLRKRIYDLGVKRILSYAKANGFDAVAWTPGEVQAGRYDLSKQVEKVEAEKSHAGNYIVKVWDKEGRKFYDNQYSGVLTETELVDTVGKELAGKIVLQKPNKSETYSGLDLKVGGEGLKTLYDKTIPAMFKKYGLENVTPTKITTLNRTMTSEVVNAENLIRSQSGEPLLKESIPVLSIPITDRTPSSMPLFSRVNRNLATQAGSTRVADAIGRLSSTPEGFKRWLDNAGSFVVNKIFPVDRAIRLAQSSPWAFPIKQYLTELQDLKKSKGKYPEARMNDAAIHAKEFVKSIKNDEQLKTVENAIWKATLYQLDPFSDLDRQWQDGEWKAVNNEEFAPAKTLAAAKADLKQAWAKLTPAQKASVKVLTDHMKSIREDHKKALLESLRYAYGIDTEAFQKKADEVEEQFAKVIRGLYMPLIRTGEFMVRTSRVENGEIGKLVEAKKFKREHQAIAYIRAMTEKGYHTTLDRDMEVIGRNYTNVPAGFMADIEKKAKDRGLEGEALENFVSDMKKLWVDTLSPNSLEGNKLHRKGVAGFDTDIIKSYGTYVSKESLAVANAQYGWRIADKYREMYRTIDDLQEPGNTTDPHDISLMLNLLHGLEASDMKRKREKIPGWIQTAQKITFMAMLSSPSTYAVQWSQPFVFTIPKMGARFGMPRATAEYLKAAKEYMSGRYADKKIDEWNRLHGKVGEHVVELIERHRVLESEMRQQLDSANRTFSTQFTAEKARGASEAELKTLRFKAEQDLARLTADLTRATKTEKEAIEKELKTTYGSLDAIGKKYLVLRVSALLGGTELSLSHDMHDIVVGADKGDADFVNKLVYAFDRTVEYSGFFMRKSETGSRKAAAVSAFNLAYNGDFIKAMDYTLKDVIDDTLNNFSTENRPELLSGPAGRLLFQFQFFRFHAIGKICQLAKDSWGREYADTMQRVWKEVADKGYTISAVSDNGATVYRFTKDGKVFDSKMQRDALPADLQKFLTTTEEAKAARRQARREFAFGMGVSFALAGAGGAPIAMLFTNTITQLLWSALAFMFEDPDDPWDLGRDFSAGLHSMVGDTAANVVEKGIPSLFGMDISKRIGMGGMANIVQGEPPPGMSASQRTSWYANRLLGPTWSLVGDIAKAQEAVANGELGKAAQYSSPKVIKDLFKTFDLANNGVTTTSGKRLLQPEDINVYSVALMLVGVNPLDVSLAREEARELGNLSVTLTQRRSRLLKDYAKAVVSDDYDARESALEKINAWAASQPRLKISYQEMATATKRALDNRAGGKLSKKEQIIKEEYGL